MRGFHDLLMEKTFPVYVVRIELNLSCFPNEIFHTSRRLVQDAVIVKLDIVEWVFH